MAYTTINKSTDYFNTKLYTGTDAAQSLTGVGFQPDWTWIKCRSHGGSGPFSHILTDAVRGANKTLFSNTTDAETINYTNGYLSAFDSDGFTVTAGDSVSGVGRTYAAWNWLGANGTSSNTDGSITSTVSANTTAGFSIVSYTGTGSDGATVGHGLGATPDCIIIKNRDDSSQSFWAVYHQGAFVSQSNPNILYLNSTAAESDDTNILGGSSVTINSTVFSLGDYNGVNGSGKDIIAYCFKGIPGYSKFGFYTGNGSSDGTFVYTGFKPAFVMIKRTDSTANWRMIDSKRNAYNILPRTLTASQNASEYTGTDDFGNTDILSNGFKIRTSYAGCNASGGTYLWMAFGQTLVGSNNVPCTAR